MTEYEGTTQGAISFFDDSSAQFRLLWTISDFLQVQERVKCPNYIELKQPVSVIPGSFNCGLEVYPNGKVATPDGTSSISVFLANKGPNNVWLNFEISVLDNNLKQQHTMGDFGRSLVKVNSIWGYTKWFSTSLFSSHRNTLLPNGSLQVLVVGTVFTNEQLSQKVEHGESDQRIISALIDVSFLSHSSEHSDACLSVEDEKFQVHKCILSKRSSVFEELFKNQTQNILVIPDISADAFRQLLQFIYTDSVTAAIDTMLPEVLKAAAKYKLGYLKDICQIKMIRNISVSNAVAYLRVAEEASDFQLKKKTIDFIAKNKIEVSKEASWKSFKVEKSDLLVEVLDRLMM